MRARAITAAVCTLTVMSWSPAGAGPALLIDAADARVIYAEDQDDHWHPASLTKIMTAYLTFEALKAGKIALDTKISCSEAANLQPASKVGLPVGAEMTVDLALKALIVKSANDVAVMLAEAIGSRAESADGLSSEEAFIQQMNATAQRLGMTRTRFVNANGLPAAEQVTTARDLAKLSRAVIRDYPEYQHLWALSDMQIGKRRLGTHNGLLKTYDGADGLKTGFICDSGYNVVASATRDGRRLIAIVLGETSGRDRALRAAGLLEHGFQMHGWKVALNAGSLDTLPIAGEAKAVVSIRSSIVSWDCGGRRPPRQRVARIIKPGKQAAASGADSGSGTPVETAGKTAAPVRRIAAEKAVPAVVKKAAVAPPTAAKIGTAPKAAVDRTPQSKAKAKSASVEAQGTKPQ